MTSMNNQLSDEHLQLLLAQALRNHGHSPAGGAYGHMGMGLQQYLPVAERRNFTSLENIDVEQAKKKIIPKIFKSHADPIHADMSSPAWSSLPPGLLGALVGGAGGGMLQKVFGGGEGFPTVGATLGALAGGGVGGGIGYMGRKAKNQTLEDSMLRLPPGGTRRDMMSDPVYQKELDRKNALMAAGAQYGRPQRTHPFA